MDWSLSHYKLQSYGRGSIVGVLAQKGCSQVSTLIWVSGQAARSSPRNVLMDDIVVTGLLPRGSYYHASGCESCWTRVLLEQHPPNVLIYDNANIVYACSNHYDTALSLVRAVAQDACCLKMV